MACSFCMGMCKPIKPNFCANYMKTTVHILSHEGIVIKLLYMKVYTHTWQESSLAWALMGNFNPWYNRVSAYKEFHTNFWRESSKICRAGAWVPTGMYFRGHVYKWRHICVTWICSIADSHWQSEASSNPIMNRIPYLWGVLESPSWYYFRKSSGWVIFANSSHNVTFLESISDGFYVNSEFLFHVTSSKPSAFCEGMGHFL